MRRTSGSIRRAGIWGARSAGPTARCSPKWCSPGCYDTSNIEHGAPVIAQLVERLENVGERLVLAFLVEAFQGFGLPAAHQLLQRRDVEVAVMEVALQPRHPARKKAPVLADRVAAHRRGIRGHVLREELERACLGLRLAERRCAHALDEAALRARARIRAQRGAG